MDHLSNYHSQPSKSYLKKIEELEKRLGEYVGLLCDDIISAGFKNIEKVKEHHGMLISFVNMSVDKEIEEIQKGDVGNRIGLLQMKILLETKDIIVVLQEMYVLYHDYHRQDK
jgi:predicted AlkP superfamily pyrophosphatase or phosphodiesterase